MKRFTFTLALISILAALPSKAQALGPTNATTTVSLAWDMSPSTNVVSYNLYYGAASRNYTNKVSVIGRTNTTTSVVLPMRGIPYYFAATARDTNGLESDYSSEVMYTPTPVPSSPVNFKVSTITP